MMLTRITLAIGAMALLVVVLPSRVSGQQPQGASADAGATYSQSGCQACHGPDGRGTAAAPSIAARPRELADFIAYVRRPGVAMPPLGPQVVSDQALTDIFETVYRSAAQAAQATQASAADGRADVGATLFRRNGCFQCHSNEGQGATQGPRIGPDPLPFARFAWYVRNPAGQMPPYTSVVMSDQDLADVYAFLQARPQPPDVSTIPLLAR